MRNYNEEHKDNEGRKYTYKFDKLMYGYIMKSFEPFFKEGSVLELGSSKGEFTGLLIDHFDNVTCVEASKEAIEEAKDNLWFYTEYHLTTLGWSGLKFYNSTFEDVVLPKKYDNIILTHVLEHVDNPVALLRKIKDEWLADGGHLFIVVPNANAASRQIAVKMGIIPYETAVIPSEAEQGHKRTYTYWNLDDDVIDAGLNTIHQSGIFFKAFANFQWDQILDTDIISKEYLDGCYELGRKYPDLSSSILLVCKK